MATPIGALTDLSPEHVATLDVTVLDQARIDYTTAILAHRLEAADYITNDRSTQNAHLGEAERLSRAFNIVADEISIRATVEKSIAAIRGGANRG